jgi:FlaA1/EpsC-like NDP-sugar epimerase
MRSCMQMDWSEFLGRPPIVDDSSLAESAVGEQSVLITGAGGSIGSDLAAVVVAGRPRALVLLDLSEGALYESCRRVSALPGASATEIVPVTGSVGDARFLDHLLRQHRPKIVFHAAAYKHVPLMERNPFSAIANNSIGTYRLVVAALEAGVSRLIAVSTDKAVNPRSVMGVSKRIAELVVLSHATSGARMNVVRLCNVLGSSGSVAEIFQEQAERGLPLTVTDVDALRYFLTPAEAARAILRAAVSPVWGRVLLPDCGEEFRILDLARFIARRCGGGRDTGFEFTGPRPGDKLREELCSADEVVEAGLADRMRVLKSVRPSAQEVTLSMARLGSAVDAFEDAELICALNELVPSYRGLAANGDSAATRIAENADPSTRASRLAQDDGSFEGSVAE